MGAQPAPPQGGGDAAPVPGAAGQCNGRDPNSSASPVGGIRQPRASSGRPGERGGPGCGRPPAPGCRPGDTATLAARAGAGEGWPLRGTGGVVAMRGGGEGPTHGGDRQSTDEVAGCMGETQLAVACSTDTVEGCPRTCGAEDPLIMTFRVGLWDESESEAARWVASCCTSMPMSMSTNSLTTVFEVTVTDFEGDDDRGHSAMDSSLATAVADWGSEASRLLRTLPDKCLPGVCTTCAPSDAAASLPAMSSSSAA